MTTQYRRNREIRAARVLLIEDGNQPQEMNFSEALRRAEAIDLDLVEVNVNRGLPVVKILDFGKFRYELEKMAKESKRRQAQPELKVMKFRPEIEEADYQTKVRHIKEFLEDGHPVRVIIWFSGREITHAERGKSVLQRVIDAVSTLAILENVPKLEGRQMVAQLKPKK